MILRNFQSQYFLEIAFFDFSRYYFLFHQSSLLNFEIVNEFWFLFKGNKKYLNQKGNSYNNLYLPSQAHLEIRFFFYPSSSFIQDFP